MLVQDANGNTVTGEQFGCDAGDHDQSGQRDAERDHDVAAVNGVATFSNLSINKAGSGYVLTATDGALTSAASNGFNITVGAAAQLAFGQQPSNATAGASISPAVTVLVQDANGNTVTSDTSNVTVAIGTNPGGGTLSGTKTVAAVNGVATFNNLSINKAGNGYVLTATDGTLDQRDQQRLQHHGRRGGEAGLFAATGQHCRGRKHYSGGNRAGPGYLLETR